MEKVIFVRHGESESNIYGIISDDYNRFPLTERGREQAKWTSEQLRSLRFDGIISSPILRAYQTAMIIGEALGMDPIIDERAKESG
ncbi:MAG: histidine phosphatase family protein, partial [Thermoplasmata archaeon]